MYEECPALLQMTRTFLEDGEKDEIIHHCKVIRYDPEEENIYLIAGKSDITSFLLDGVYRCTINSEKKEIWCQGVIRERYCNKVGKVLVFRVQNGFYEKNINRRLQSQESYYLDSLKKNHSRQKLWQLDQAELLMEKK